MLTNITEYMNMKYMETAKPLYLMRSLLFFCNTTAWLMTLLWEFFQTELHIAWLEKKFIAKSCCRLQGFWKNGSSNSEFLLEISTTFDFEVIFSTGKFTFRNETNFSTKLYVVKIAVLHSYLLLYSYPITTQISLE